MLSIAYGWTQNKDCLYQRSVSIQAVSSFSCGTTSVSRCGTTAISTGRNPPGSPSNWYGTLASDVTRKPAAPSHGEIGQPAVRARQHRRSIVQSVPQAAVPERANVQQPVRCVGLRRDLQSAPVTGHIKGKQPAHAIELRLGGVRPRGRAFEPGRGTRIIMLPVYPKLWIIVAADGLQDRAEVARAADVTCAVLMQGTDHVRVKSATEHHQEYPPIRHAGIAAQIDAIDYSLAHSSGDCPIPKCRARRFSLPDGNTDSGTPGRVRLTSSAAVPSPPTPIKARSRPSV